MPRARPPARPVLPSRPARDAQPEDLGALGGLVPIARSSVVDAVAEQLQAEILAGRLAAGARLPSERELALALGVNRLTLRAALARLEALGLVTTRHGAGTLVTSWRERAGLDTLPSLIGSLSPGDPQWRKLVKDVLEVRRVLAAEAVALAAVRYTEGDLAELRRIRDDQTTRLHDALSYARGDMAFQRVLVRAAGNVGFELVLNSFARFPDEHPELVAKLYDRRHEAVDLYDAMLALLTTRDPELARTSVRSALEAMDAAWLDRHAPETPAKASKGRKKP
ncbi:MAG: FadR family transcriptional regulator [Myxococcales bacterium]|nr:FadR family transcriptional regulator [Myxococcales bacterium]MBL0197269.1 FadR family transcriptional regulator [Myxococcales bacterium]